MLLESDCGGNEKANLQNHPDNKQQQRQDELGDDDDEGEEEGALDVSTSFRSNNLVVSFVCCVLFCVCLC